ncbi:hypothetical protein Trydic_g22301 [Trypoxylus dichotomus]
MKRCCVLDCSNNSSQRHAVPTLCMPGYVTKKMLNIRKGCEQCKNIFLYREGIECDDSLKQDGLYCTSCIHIFNSLANKNLINDYDYNMLFFSMWKKHACKQWIINSGNTDLSTLSPEKLKRRFICELHFRKEDRLTKKLTKCAVPVPYFQRYNVEKVYTSSNVIGSKPSTSRASSEDQKIKLAGTLEQEKEQEQQGQEHILTGISNMTSPSMKRTLDVTEATVISRDKQVEILKRRLKMLPRKINAMPPLPRSIVRMQLYHKRRTPWLSDEKNAALSIFYKSPSIYKYLRSKGVVLPSPSTIGKWLKNYDCRPGIRKKFLTFLKQKAETISQKQ